MRRYLDYTFWVLLFAFLPFTVLVLLSQNSLPGEFFYPVKIGMENVILAAASFSPATRVAFRTDLTERRFDEAQQLLVSHADTSAYNNFVVEIASAQQDLSTLSNPKDKLENSDKLIAKINEYQKQLSQVKNEVQVASGQTPPSQTPVATSLQTSTPAKNVPVSTPSTPLSNTQQTSTPLATVVPVVSQIPLTPTPTPVALAPSVASVIASNPQKAEELTQSIENTKKQLIDLEQKVKKEQEDAQFKEKVREVEGKNDSGQNSSDH